MIRGALAASTIRRLPRAIYKLPHPVYTSKRNVVRRYVLFPEYPRDTEATNPFLRFTSLKLFDEISSNTRFITAMAKVCQDVEFEIHEHFKKFEDPTFPRTYETIVEPINQGYGKLTFVRNAMAIRIPAFNDENMLTAYERAQQSHYEVIDTIHTDISIHGLLQELSKNKDLTEHQMKCVEFCLWQSKMHGVNSPQPETIIRVKGILEQKAKEFVNSVEICTTKFSHTIVDKRVMQEVPEWIRDSISLNTETPSAGPWKITLEEPLYSLLLQFISDRQERFNIWYAKNNMSGVDYVDEGFTNHVALDDIVEFRHDYAKICFLEPSYADLMLHHSMAGNVDTVLEMLDEFRGPLYARAKAELDSLNEFALQDGFEEDYIEEHDVQYYSNKQMSQLFSFYKDCHLSIGFHSGALITNCMQLCTTLFGVTFHENTTVPVPHPSVKVYDVRSEEGQLLTTYYIDFVERPGKQQSAFYTTGCNLQGDFVKFNYHSLGLLPEGMELDASGLTFDDLKKILFTFGKLMQECLTKNPSFFFEETEYDAGLIGGKFLEQFAFEPEFLKEIDSTCSVIERPLDDELIREVYKHDGYLMGYNKCHSLMKAAFDLELHSGKTSYYEIQENVWAAYMPIRMPDRYNPPCSDVDMFMPGGGCVTYRYLWAEMIAVDIYQTFEGIGFGNKDKLGTEGRRLRDVLLANVKAIPAKELFRRYRGRDHSTLPFLRKYKVDT